MQHTNRFMLSLAPHIVKYFLVFISYVYDNGNKPWDYTRITLFLIVAPSSSAVAPSRYARSLPLSTSI